MRPVVNSTIQASSRVARKQRKQQSQAPAQPHLAVSESNNILSQNDRLLEFPTTSSSQPRRLNEVVVSPPNIRHLPRGVARNPRSDATGKHEGILSLAQRALMETEREKAILRYREMKEKARTTTSDDREISHEQS